MPLDLKSSGGKIERMTSPGVITRNALANLVKPSITWLVVLFLPPLLVRELDKSSYATWVLLLQIGAYITMVDTSVDRVTMYFVARARGLRDDDYMSRMVSSAGCVLTILAAIAILASILTSWQFAHLFTAIPHAIASDASRALLVTGCSLAIALPFVIFSGLFRGFQQNKIPVMATTIGRILGAIGTGWAAYRHQGLTAMACWTAGGVLLSRVIYVVAWERRTTEKLLHVSRVTSVAMREFFHIWSVNLVVQSCGVLISGLDIPIVAAFDFSSAAYYGVAATLTTILLVLQQSIMEAATPAMSGLSAQASPERVGSALVKLTRYGTTTLILIALPLVFGMAIFLRLWVTERYSVHALPLALILVIAQFIRGTMGSYALTAFGAGQQKQTLISPLAEGVVNLTASLVLVHRMGALGVAIGTLIGAVIGVIVHLTISMRLTDAVRLRRRQFLIQGILRPLACCIPAVFVLFAIQWITPSIFWHVLGILAGEALAAATLFRGNFDSSEQAQLIGFGKQFARRVVVRFA